MQSRTNDRGEEVEHYFTENTEVEHNIKEMKFEINYEKFSFSTDNAVFSKARVDFGSELLIKTVLNEETKPDSILDVGCGYGPIGITLARFYFDAIVCMCDINNRAIDLAHANIKKNDIKNAEAINSNIYGNIKGKYELIVTNPPIRAGKKVVHEILEKAKEHLKVNGKIYAVIQKKQGAESAKKKLEVAFGNCEIVEKKAGFWILRSVRN